MATPVSLPVIQTKSQNWELRGLLTSFKPDPFPSTGGWGEQALTSFAPGVVGSNLKIMAMHKACNYVYFLSFLANLVENWTAFLSFCGTINSGSAEIIFEIKKYTERCSCVARIALVIRI